jgi:ATP-dependent Clp protease ATP-binding subunit ClpA
MPPESRESDETMANFTPRAQQVLALARQEAQRFHHHFVGTEHLLLGLIRLGQGTGVAVLGRMGLDLEAVRLEVENQIGKGPDQKGSGLFPYTPRVKKVLALAAKESKALNHTYVGTEHILLGLLREGDGVAARVLKNLGLDTDVTRQHILRELDPNFSPLSEDTAMPQKPEPQKSQREPVDISKRYDVYCQEGNQQVVYRNALFKGVKTFFQKEDSDLWAEYMELEQAVGQTVFVSRSSVIKFCEHGKTPGSEMVFSTTP